MKRFLVGSKTMNWGLEFNIGIAPGKFDTKQLILSSLAVLIFSNSDRLVRFVRTLNRDELAKCHLFINDDFTTEFPVIPSFHDVKAQWEKDCDKIIENTLIKDDEGIQYVKESVSKKICNLEAIDCLMELYSRDDTRVDSFENALNVTLQIIEKEISDSVQERMHYNTIKLYVERATSNYILPPFYVQGWRNIVDNVNGGVNIDYAIFSDDDGSLMIECYDKNIILKKYIKGMPDIIYSGRFFVKVSDINAAKKVISKLPKLLRNTNSKFA